MYVKILFFVERFKSHAVNDYNHSESRDKMYGGSPSEYLIIWASLDIYGNALKLIAD